MSTLTDEEWHRRGWTCWGMWSNPDNTPSPVENRLAHIAVSNDQPDQLLELRLADVGWEAVEYDLDATGAFMHPRRPRPIESPLAELTTWSEQHSIDQVDAVGIEPTECLAWLQPALPPESLVMVNGKYFETSTRRTKEGK